MSPLCSERVDPLACWKSVSCPCKICALYSARLSDMRDFERAGNSVLLNRLPLRRHGHDIDRTQCATRQEIYAPRTCLRRHLCLSRHRNHVTIEITERRVSVSVLMSVLRAPERTRLSLRISDESQRLWLQVWVYLCPCPCPSELCCLLSASQWGR
jgi:hypothetical protein